MDTLYQLGRATAAELMKALPGEPSDSTVRTQLRVLEAKGHVRHEEEGLRYVYLPVVPRRVVRKSALKHLVNTFFDGSVGEGRGRIAGTGRRALERRRARSHRRPGGQSASGGIEMSFALEPSPVRRWCSPSASCDCASLRASPRRCGTGFSPASIVLAARQPAMHARAAGLDDLALVDQAPPSRQRAVRCTSSLPSRSRYRDAITAVTAAAQSRWPAWHRDAGSGSGRRRGCQPRDAAARHRRGSSWLSSRSTPAGAVLDRRRGARCAARARTASPVRIRVTRHPALLVTWGAIDPGDPAAGGRRRVAGRTRPASCSRTRWRIWRAATG